MLGGLVHRLGNRVGLEASALRARMAEGALKDRSGYCRKERKKTQKTGKAGNETGQSQDGFPFLGSFRLLRQTLFRWWRR
jgi:hypothetical protein